MSERKYRSYTEQFKLEALALLEKHEKSAGQKDVANTVLYLASPAASCVTAEIIKLNGGSLFGR